MTSNLVNKIVTAAFAQGFNVSRKPSVDVSYGVSDTSLPNGVKRPIRVTVSLTQPTSPSIGSVWLNMDASSAGYKQFHSWDGREFVPVPDLNTPTLLAVQQAALSVSSGSNQTLSDASVKVLSSSGYVSNLRAKLTAQVISAKHNNSIDNTPFYKPPTWAQNTYYGQGAIVTSTDGVNAYVQVYSLGGQGGTSATTGAGPTGKQAAAYTDGTCKWLWVGQARGLSNFDATVVTYSSSATANALYAHKRTITLSEAAYNAGGLPLKVIGGIPGTFRNGLCAMDQNGATAAAPDLTAPAECAGIRFGTDADVISIGTLYPTWGFGKDNFSTCVVVVNGRRICDSMFYSSAVNEYLTIDLSKVVPAGSDKDVVVYCKSGLTNIIADSAARFWDPSSAADLTIAFEGDSSTRGGNTANAQPGGWPIRVGQKLRFANVINYAIGATRFTNSSTKTSFVERIDRLMATGADIFFVTTHNDVDNPGAGISQATRVPKFTEYFNAFLTKAPGKYLIVGGCLPLQNELDTECQPGGVYYQCETDLKNAVAALNSRFVIFVPFVLDPQGMPTTGNGASDSLTYDGNADWLFGPDKDGNQDGHGNARHSLLLGNAIAKKIEKAINLL